MLYTVPLTAICMVFLVRGPLHTQETEPKQDPLARPTRLWQTGPQEAMVELADPGVLSRLRSRAEEDGDAKDWLALGAALLHTGDWEGATPPLRQALETSQPEQRTDAEYDLALAYAVSADPASPDRKDGPPSSRREVEGEAAEEGGTPRDRLIRAREWIQGRTAGEPGCRGCPLEPRTRGSNGWTRTIRGATREAEKGEAVRRKGVRNRAVATGTRQ